MNVLITDPNFSVPPLRLTSNGPNTPFSGSGFDATSPVKWNWNDRISFEREPLNVMDRKFFDRLQITLESHYKKPGFNVRRLAQELALSERQLQRRLKALTMQTPVHFLRIFRLEHSIELLSEGWPVGQVALSVGFASPAHYSSCFRTHFGCTPTAFRNNRSRRSDAKYRNIDGLSNLLRAKGQGEKAL